MLWIGPTSSIFDITTYLVMLFFISPLVVGNMYPEAAGMSYRQMVSNFTADSVQVKTFVSLFQTGWFVESLATQTLVIHMIRTQKVPFIQSRAAKPLLISTSVAVAVGIALPFIPGVNTVFKMSNLPLVYFAVLVVTIITYIALVTIVKKLYVKRYGELL